MNRLEQDAADALQGHEDRAAFRDAERARWARAQPAVIVGTAQPLFGAQRKAHADWLKQHEAELPF